MKESDTLLDTDVPKYSNKDSTEISAATTVSKVLPVYLVPSCVQTSTPTRPLATSTSN